MDGQKIAAALGLLAVAGFGVGVGSGAGDSSAEVKPIRIGDARTPVPDEPVRTTDPAQPPVSSQASAVRPDRSQASGPKDTAGRPAEDRGHDRDEPAASSPGSTGDEGADSAPEPAGDREEAAAGDGGGGDAGDADG